MSFSIVWIYAMADIKRVLEYDPTTRTKTIYHYDWKTDDSYLQRVQDVEPIIEENKLWRHHVDQSKRDMKRVASIPLNVYYSIPREIRQDGKLLRQWLNNPENFAFKTWEGTV